MESIYAALDWRATATPQRPFIKAGERWRTFAEIDYDARSFAAGLAQRGVKPGDTVAHIAPNCEELIVSFMACAYLGAVNVSLNIYLKGDFLRHQLVDSGATVLVADRAGAATGAPLLAGTDIAHVVLIDKADNTGLGLPATVEVADFAALMVPPVSELRAHSKPTDIFGIVYTSGTTGPSKGCMLSNGYYLQLPEPFLLHNWVAPGDRIFTALPLFHSAAQVVLMKALTVEGVSACFERQFSASRFLDQAAAAEATITWGVGPMAAVMLAQPPDRSDTAWPLRLAIWHSADRALLERWETRFGSPVVGGGYGQTEVAAVTLARPEDRAARGTMGTPCANFEIRVADDDDQPVGPGEVGELLIRPRAPLTTFSGYWRNPQATVAAWRNLWHHTGDYVTADANGNIVFADRKKDAVRRRGENVSSFELETAIAQHPDVQRVAVTAVHAVVGDDEIKVSVVPTPGSTIVPGELYEFFAQTLPYFAIPRYLDVRESLPLTPTDRVQKHVLRAEGVQPHMVDFEQLGLSVARSARRA
ncbi:AMP-binding protein [Mycobacterium saskatchewanense]|uniref:ATP-dependent acyl-CoA ligase n=1 Tax=Mycobacterium saskatchewanense TaxID=220927 RepID=A0AAJ3TW19_9MYCO|nr:AMP-binding protein [Mycobacterium saskatchewanense]ORW72932.1 hypothetical protein AWC23_08745 [Mycobacterium saskatchewanense]